MPEPRPCPFFGHPAKLEISEGWSAITDTACGVTMWEAGLDAAARVVTRWNTRVQASV